MLQFHSQVEALVSKFAFETVTPNAQTNDLLGDGLCKKKGESTCYPRNYAGNKKIGGSEMYGCPEDMCAARAPRMRACAPPSPATAGSIARAPLTLASVHVAGSSATPELPWSGCKSVGTRAGDGEGRSGPLATEGSPEYVPTCRCTKRIRRRVIGRRPSGADAAICLRALTPVCPVLDSRLLHACACSLLARDGGRYRNVTPQALAKCSALLYGVLAWFSAWCFLARLSPHSLSLNCY